MRLAVLPILELPNPTLRQRAKKVRTIDSDLLRLAYDMVDTLHEANGVGLAANQVGELRRLIVIHMPEDEETRIYINPEITQREGEREVEEGCLSIPGYRGNIKRSVWIKFKALDHTEKTVKFKAEDLLAQALEHEVDHLNGILYIDHLESHEKLIPIEPDEGNSEDSEGEPTSEEDSSQEFKRNDNGLWVPESNDSLDTPASLKTK